MVVALAVGAIPLLMLLWRRLRRKEALPEALPSEGVFTLATLARFDGVRNPICLGVCGKVVDVSTSENIKHGEGYGKLWAGKDATYSLATLSLKPEDANILAFKLSDFTAEQHKALAGWYKHFTTKYKVVGTLKEYEGWDWSSVEELAKSQTPFGAPKTDTPAAAPESAGVILSRGDRVVIQGMEASRKELNGAAGVLQTYSAEKGGFEVKLDSGETAIFQPAQLAKA